MKPTPPLDVEMFAKFGIAEARELEEFPGYAVSSCGRVFSCRWSDGRRPKNDKRPEFGPIWREMRLRIQRRYYQCALRKGQVPVNKRVHHLVLETFVGPRPQGFYGCHNNGDGTDNRVENLRWDTPSANSLDRSKHGFRGEKMGVSKLTDANVKEIYQLSVTGMTSIELSARYGVIRQTIQEIVAGKQWQHMERPAELLAQFERCGGNPSRRSLAMGCAKRRGLTFDEYMTAIEQGCKSYEADS